MEGKVVLQQIFSKKDVRSIKEGVNCIENQGENWYKMALIKTVK